MILTGITLLALATAQAAPTSSADALLQQVQQQSGPQRLVPDERGLISIPGYYGPLPKVLPAITHQQRGAMLSQGADPVQVWKMYRESLEPRAFRVPGGILQIAPDANGGPHWGVFLPSQ